MEVDTFLRGEDQQSFHGPLTHTHQIKRKNENQEKITDEKSADPIAKAEKDQAENIATLLMRNYDLKLSGEDDTSQPTSRAAPVIPMEPTRKKKKRKRRMVGMKHTLYNANCAPWPRPPGNQLPFEIKSQISICLTNCRYESIRKVASAFGMREVSEEDAWNFYWTDMSVSVERAKEMKRFQRINHFPGMLEICRKDLLARNLNRMQKIYPKEYNFFPKTWCLPADFGEALNYSKSRKNKTFIIKPECGSQGRGIYLTKSLKDIKPTDKLICQVYLSKPYLVDGYKFDIRVYTLITSCDPLRIFVYNEGLVRFATSRYADPNVNNTTNVFMHLTNYALNKHSRTYVYDSEAGSKRKISTLNKILLSQGVDLDRLWHAIDQVIVKTIISAWPILKHSYHACFPSHDMVHACFEILGFDILLDHKLHPFILEVNHSPSFHTDTQLDREVKEGLLTDTFTMLNIWQCDKKRVLDEDRKRIRDRLLQTNKFSEFTPNEEKEPEKSPWQMQIQWEETHLGNFRRVYPVGEQYASLFQQPSGSLYTGTASSRARGDCTRLQREEFQQTKAKAEALKKPSQPKGVKEGEKKAADEASTVAPSTVAGTATATTNTNTDKTKAKKDKEPKKKEKDDKTKLIQKPSLLQQILPEKETKPPYVLCSFEPDPIVEKEERERVNLLAQRDFLIRSYGMLEQIYLVMKKMGTLRPEDERKYGVYGRLSVVSNSPKTAVKKSKTNVKHKPEACGDHFDELVVQCRDAVMCARPAEPERARRSTRAHLVRMAYTAWKMNSLIVSVPPPSK
ncbi:tubulin polyglutamylase ttll6-like isoform X2 [Plodia interpunctella]|uniref:tubulin polyglutamylase ttll6-like isoform X2 n=1 Tax=Plodia interpunctella TaxID=58824 RepID=UPI00236752B3|nr:tubulin polyglutamylase ttll6-like isoform X2 [Plodia interpunctella]